MAFSYAIKDQSATYFLTFTVHQWVDVFTRKIYTDQLLNSIKHCQKQKGLLVYAYVIMTNHCHFIMQSTKVPLSDIIRDFKKYTAKSIVKAIEENPQESRKNWLLWLLKKEEGIWFWKEGYHGEEITSAKFMATKINYIHLNPVKAGIVEKEEEYLNSSCGEFYGIRNSPIELAPL
ncbi:transposase [Echinicola strongylocentroti]|uniref:Transposase n=1 Tax=Echinicola strongylocentroti TaxID=1795355 RepID=A0A2Z4IHR5_9BACT|nr:transposase [Echinicola strongylocentroti]AWW30662.1 transposase [Echinicola strongylocentroti]